MERSLAEAQRDDDDRLRSRYGDLLRTNGHALVTGDGRLLSEPAARLEIPEGGGVVGLLTGAAEWRSGSERERSISSASSTRGRGSPRARGAALCRARDDRVELEVDGQPCRLSRRHSEVLVSLRTASTG
jgi:hypothetical protein